MSSGAVTAGLVGDSQLVFDLWGEPVDDAERLASMAPQGRVYVSATSRPRLPGDLRLVEVQTVTGDSAWMIDPAVSDAEAPT